MNQKFNLQLRTLLAIGLSLAFLFFYNNYFIKKIPTNDINQSIQEFQKQENSIDIKQKLPINKIETSEQFSLETSNFDIKFDKLARVKSFKLKQEKYLLDGEYLELIDENAPAYPLEMRFSNSAINSESFVKGYELVSNTKIDDKNKIVFKQILSDLSVTKTIIFEQSGKFDIEVTLSRPEKFFITNGIRPSARVDQLSNHGTIIGMIDNRLEIIKDGDAVNNAKFENVKFISGFDRYYTSILFSKNLKSVVTQSSAEEEAIPFIILDTNSMSLNGYIGPKYYDTLVNIDEGLADSIEYGFFTIIAKPMFRALDFIHDYIGNWGWAIIILTILIKILMFPLVYRGMMSLNRVKDIQPKLKELQAKYKSDPKMMSQKTMQLYRTEKVNPIGGCLPMLLQIPIFFALYRVILNAVELQGAPWILWINDLSVLDPYYVLPVLTGVTMFWQQHISPNTISDPMQAKIMKFLPVIFTVVFLFFPAGLTLYWFVNNLLSVGQQYIINKSYYSKKKDKR
ncbi:MAG: Inner membrane protein translocase component YidC, long form [uncultured Campylobacterales bacterium]|uniref:Membrane protein insertase YidC n=1 Tax=uncultured Campylobacterales bacterium TaxID=352960 RepID=A0A6S6STX2_9BACT|nr:MAG: Inner membrane protein translocase component YidC, long form [uncultured Campylobacterales bacterium]